MSTQHRDLARAIHTAMRDGSRSLINGIRDPHPKWYQRVLTSVGILIQDTPVAYATAKLDGDNFVAHLLTDTLIITASAQQIATDPKVSAKAIRLDSVQALEVSEATPILDFDVHEDWPGPFTATLTAAEGTFVLPLDDPSQGSNTGKLWVVTAGIRARLAA